MDRLDAFDVWYDGDKLTPPLVTARSFGEWCKKVFSEQICRNYLYVGSRKKGSEYHPGTKIGAYFDSNEFTSSKYNSVYIPTTSEAFHYLIKKHLAAPIDACQARKEDKFNRCLRCFTVPQIRLFVQEMIKDTGLDFQHFNVSVRLFTINTTYKDSRSYCVKFSPNKMPLFGCSERVSPTPMTLSEVEGIVGHKILLVSEKENGNAN